MNSATVDREIARIAARQHGVVTRSQLLELGLSPGAVDARVRARRLQPRHRGVYLPGSLVGPLVPPRAREMAAVLACGPGAVLSHGSAAVLLGLLLGPASGPASGSASGPGPGPVEVTVVGRDPRRPGIRVHRVRTLPERETRVVDGILVTAPGRTLLDLAGTVRARTLEQAVARAERLGHIDCGELARAIAVGAPRRGRRRLLAILERASSPALTRSKAEDRLLELVRRAGLPDPVANAQMAGLEVDFLWPDRGVAVEVDGFAYHRSRRSFELDRRRDAKLAAEGIRTLRVTWRQLERESEVFLVRLTRTLFRDGA